MPVKAYKPTSPGRRAMTSADLSEITKSRPEKSLLAPLKKTGGRNNMGRTTARFRGGGHKRRYRVIDFKRDKDDVPATVVGIEYDPNRTARIALLEYEDGERRYIVAPEGLKAGATVMSGEGVEPRTGNCLPLGRVPLGLFVHNVELQPGRGGQIVRGAGTGAQVSAREGRFVHLIMPSGEIRRVLRQCRGTIGHVGNVEHQNVKLGKAGRRRWLGRRPHVRGTAQNPVSHPMGGGEGRRAGGRHPCGLTGVLSKGGKTRRVRKYSDPMIVRKRKRRK
ncbi:MAG: 50S ribosomal protein L2 [Planctomycetes bacterium SM23_32]|nr:MAG: 50S ribosomal protein L2 [Planctomycetes bacterium SM23_32]